MNQLTIFEKGLVAHLAADWLLQNEWIAINKSKLLHPAAWCHAGLHASTLSIPLGWRAGLALAGIHLVVDTRMPLDCWQQLIGQRRDGAIGQHIAIWADQVIHILTLALWIALNKRARKH